MTTVQFFPPHAEAMAAMEAIPAMTVAPTMFITQEGPEGAIGPEGAGAILLLQATFTKEEGARHFWDAAVPLMNQLAEAPGFLRRYSFFANDSITLLAFWRTIEDARRFAASADHRQASRALFTGRWQQSHFSGLWELHSSHGRVLFCEECDGMARAPVTRCPKCDAALLDVFSAGAADRAGGEGSADAR
ncbi:MAG TPA: hypothetical protein VE991_11280 [Acidimicrobiales bacterium]|nr:hypothetical protein [Acidimicrobiales bacterium]